MLLLALLAVPASASTWDDKVDSVCVKRKIDSYWGVAHAVRQWNQIDAGQPKYRLRAECRYWNTVVVKSINRVGWKHGGIAIPIVSADGSKWRYVVKLNNPATAGFGVKRKRHWRRFASTHELGHTLGLSHNQHIGSVMCYDTNWYRNNGVPSRYDRRTLHNLY